MTQLKRYLELPLVKHLLIFTICMMIVWSIHVVVISVAAFFHFILDYRLAHVESWIFDRAWEIIIFCKLIGLTFILKFVYLKSDSRSPLREQFLSGIKWPGQDIWGLVLASHIVLYLFIKPVMNPEMTTVLVLKNLINYLGLVIFFMTDIFLIDALERMNPLRSKKAELRNFILAAIVFFSMKVTYGYAENITALVAMFIFFTFSLHSYKKFWIETFVYIALFLAPTLVLLGHDFIWKSSYSPFVSATKEMPTVFLAIFIMSIVYVGYRQQQMRRPKLKS